MKLAIAAVHRVDVFGSAKQGRLKPLIIGARQSIQTRMQTLHYTAA
jgi:hypothetical protein